MIYVNRAEHVSDHVPLGTKKYIKIKSLTDGNACHGSTLVSFWRSENRWGQKKTKKYFELYLELAIERAPRLPHLTLLQLEHLHGELVASLACSTVNANYEGNLQARCGTKSAGATKLAFSKRRRNPEQIWTSRYFLDTSIMNACSAETGCRPRII